MSAKEAARLPIAYQGEPGAYSEEALLVLFPDSEPVGQHTFAQAFSALEAGSVAKAVVPVENSLAGIVQEVNDLLWERSPSIAVAAGYAHKVRHCLLGRPGPVEKAASHPQALGQCRHWLKDRGMEPVPFYDTAGAARWVAEERPPATAAIASRAAARHYGLEVIAEDIQDQQTNQTRFLVLERRAEGQDGWPSDVAPGWKASLAFAAPHRPGSLAAALEPFSKRGINLTRLDSRPVPERPFNYLFYLDFEVGADPTASRDALLALRQRAAEVRLFGVYQTGASMETLSNVPQ